MKSLACPPVCLAPYAMENHECNTAARMKMAAPSTARAAGEGEQEDEELEGEPVAEAEQLEGQVGGQPAAVAHQVPGVEEEAPEEHDLAQRDTVVLHYDRLPFQGICTVISMSLLSFTAEMAVAPWASTTGRPRKNPQPGSSA